MFYIHQNQFSGSVLLKRGNFGHEYHVLRGVYGWELWVGTHNEMDDPLHDGIWPFYNLFCPGQTQNHS